MSDILISYARLDQDTARALARALEKQGWSVWWDTNIPTGKGWRKVLEAELASARCVVVMWSRHSVESDNVQDEAEEGKKRRILIPVLIEPVEPPLGFRGVQFAELFDWDGTEQFPGFQKLTADIRGLLSVKETAQPTRRSPDRATAFHSDAQVSPAQHKRVAAQLEAIVTAARAALSKPAREPVTDQDWARVTELELAYSGIDETGLRYIVQRESLEYLDLSGNCITDAALQCVSRLRQLEYLDLSSNPAITDAGLAHLRANGRLKHLNLAGTSISASGLRQLTGLANLSELVLRGTRITVEGVDSLSGFSALARVDLGNTALADDVVPHLARLVHLEFLGLRHTQISEGGRDRLKRALPRCRVVV